MTLKANLHAQMKNIRGYRLEMTPHYRWEHNTNGGFTMQEEMVAYIDVGTDTPKREHLTWMSVANVYKAKRGNRFIAEVKGYSKLFRFQTLREAMRMAKFLYQTKSKF
jgi:hypothetical protein